MSIKQLKNKIYSQENKNIKRNIGYACMYGGFKRKITILEVVNYNGQESEKIFVLCMINESKNREMLMVKK